LKELITVIYATSPHNLGASTSMFDVSYESINSTSLQECPVILCADGINPHSRFNSETEKNLYRNYLNKIKDNHKDVQVIESKTHLGLTYNYMQAWNSKLINTPYVLLMNHDVAFCDDFLHADLESMLNNWPSDVKMLIFPRFSTHGIDDSWWSPQSISDIKGFNEHWQDCKIVFGNQDNGCVLKKEHFPELVKKFYRAQETHFIEDSIQEFISRLEKKNLDTWRDFGAVIWNNPSTIHLDGQSKAGEGFRQVDHRNGEKVWSTGYADWRSICRLSKLTKQNSKLDKSILNFLEDNRDLHKQCAEEYYKKALQHSHYLSINSKLLKSDLKIETYETTKEKIGLPFQNENVPIHLKISSAEIGIYWTDEALSRKLLLRLKDSENGNQICWGGHPLGYYEANKKRAGIDARSKMSLELFDFTENRPPYDKVISETFSLEFCQLKKDSIILNQSRMKNENIQLHLCAQDGSKVFYEDKGDGIFCVKNSDIEGCPSIVGFFYIEEDEIMIQRSWTFEIQTFAQQSNPTLVLMRDIENFFEETLGEKSDLTINSSSNAWQEDFQELHNALSSGD